MSTENGTYALIVDDDDTSIMVVENVLLQMGYEIRIAHNGREALEILRSHPTHLVITDWEMPEMTGIELCQAIRKGDFHGYVYIIMITGHNGEQQKLQGLMAGADNFIAKPVKPAEMLVCLKTAERILSLETCELAIFALARLAESRDLETGAHVERVQQYATVLAERLATSERFKGTIDAEYIRLLHQTCPLHDIGKVGIPDAVLLKPGRLDERETQIMRTHAMIGAQTLDAALQRFPNAKFLRMARQIAATHHEQYDGTGYPAGLIGDAIPLCGRIVALADVYDALTSKRVYKSALTHDQAREIILRESGSHFDPDIVAAFQASEKRFIEIWERLGANEGQVVSPLLANVAALSERGEGTQEIVLVVEDDPSQQDCITSALTSQGYTVLSAPDGKVALELLHKHRPRIILSDLAMPGMNGTELCRRVRSLDHFGYVFFLMLTMHNDKGQMIEAFDAGADDFMPKPFHHGELLARLRAGLRTIRLHDELSRRSQGVQQLNAQLIELNNKLERLAVTDELTGLYNRRQAIVRLQERVEFAVRYASPLSVAMIDVDHFKALNDRYGHGAGDTTLREIAVVLQANVRSTDTVCRIGGEEFLIIFPSQTSQEAALSLERCRAAIASQTVNTSGEPITVSISAGISALRAGKNDYASLMREADVALYEAKAAGRNCVRVAMENVMEPAMQ